MTFFKDVVHRIVLIAEHVLFPFIICCCCLYGEILIVDKEQGPNVTWDHGCLRYWDWQHSSSLRWNLGRRISNIMQEGCVDPWSPKLIEQAGGLLTLWRPQLPHWYSYKASCARPG